MQRSFGGKKAPCHWRWQTPGPGWRPKSPAHSPGQVAKCSPASGKPPWKAGRPGILIGEFPLVAPQARRIRHKHARQREKRGGGNRSRDYPPKPIHCLTVPRTTSLTNAKHSPVDSGSRLQLPGGNAAVGAGLSQNAVQRRPHPASFLRSSSFSPWRHAGGPEVWCWRDPKPATCSVRRWEGPGAGSRGGEWEDGEEGRGEGRVNSGPGRKMAAGAEV